jgi:hypothetical protein
MLHVYLTNICNLEAYKDAIKKPDECIDINLFSISFLGKSSYIILHIKMNVCLYGTYTNSHF